MFTRRIWRASSPRPSAERGAVRHGVQRATPRGRDVHYTLTVSFLDAANGTTARITMPEGKTLDVRIPAGVEDGHILRLKRQGMPRLGGGPPGDALVEIAVAPHPPVHRGGRRHRDRNCRHGAGSRAGRQRWRCPTIKGKVRLTDSPGFRHRHAPAPARPGIREGHQFVQLQVVLPPGEEPELAEFLKDWTPRQRRSTPAGMEDHDALYRRRGAVRRPAGSRTCWPGSSAAGSARKAGRWCSQTSTSPACA